MKKKIIQKVWKNKGNNQKLVTIPKDCDIKEGDYVDYVKGANIGGFVKVENAMLAQGLV